MINFMNSFIHNMGLVFKTVGLFDWFILALTITFVAASLVWIGIYQIWRRFHK